MLHDRCVKVILYSLVIVVLAGIFKPAPVDPLLRAKTEDARFWVVKTHFSGPCDMMLLGDSRLYRAVSPAAMQTVLPGYRILNFGYSSGGLNPIMYQEVAKRLHGTRLPKIVVLAVTPYSLTPEAARNEHFVQELTRTREDIYQRRYINPYLKFFEPTTPHRISRALRGKKVLPSELYYQEFHDDGWIASWIVPDNPAKALASYRETFSKTQVSPHLEDELMRYTKIWSAKGIRVFAFRPPTTRAMVVLEEQLSGFDEKTFVKRFREAGGVWLSFPPARYHSYDGSHLNKKSAIILSEDLAAKIRQYSVARCDTNAPSTLQ